MTQQKIESNIVNRTLLILPVIILFSLAVYSGILIYADFSASNALSNIDTRLKKQVLPDEADLQESIANLQKALLLDSSNPDYLDKEAMLHRYMALSFQPESEQANSANRQALDLYRHLLTLRPSWASYWGSIISIKYDLWEFDDEMIAALHNAARLAPWDKTNQHIVIRTGFHGWPFIDNETKEVVNSTLERAMLLQTEPTMRLALEQGFIDRLAPYVEGNEELKEMYERYVASSKKKL